MTSSSVGMQNRDLPRQSSVIVRSEDTLRNAGLLLVQRGVLIAGVTLFAVVVPRLMGPELYGRYALITSLFFWFGLVAHMGLPQVISRYVPQLALEESNGRLSMFLGRLMTVRLAGAAVAASLYLAITILWLRDLDGMALGLVAGAVFVRAVANLIFVLFLGLNRAARWKTGEVVRAWVLPALLIPGFLLAGLRGACLGLLLTELVVFFAGLRWARPYIPWLRPRWDVLGLAPYFRFGLLFFASSLLLVTFRRSGETMVRAVSNDYVQVGYFGVAFSLYLALELAVVELTQAFAPLFTTLRTQGRTDALRRWAERLLKGLAVMGILALLGLLLLGNDLVPLVLGAAYRPVVLNLLPLILTLLASALGRVAYLQALVYDRPGEALAAAGVRLAAFWVLGPLLIAWRGSFGACLAMLVASVLYAILFTWRMQRVVRYSLRPWALVILLGALFLPLAWLPAVLGMSSWLMNVGLYAVFVVGYGGLLLLLRVVTLDEIAAVKQAIRSGSQAIETN